MKRTILANREDIKKVKAEEQYNFTVHVLQAIPLPIEDILPDTLDEFTVDQKIQLRKLCDTFGVSIVDDRDGGVMIYVDQTLIAEWKKCLVTLRIDHSEVNPSKKMYAEVHTEWWTIFDGENQ